ncbi:MAG TPA: hypothetical protein VF469_32545, partial [Kofleriaceae bacterium]
MTQDYRALFPRPFAIPARPDIRAAHAAPDRHELHWVLENAALAPSGGNFQPWKFAWDGARLGCLFDEERTHYFTNYRHCETHVSLGAAVTNIEVAAQAIGFAADVVPFPAGDGANPVCELTFRSEPPQSGIADLAAAIPYRMTSRIRGDRAPLASGDQDALASLAAAYGAKILWITDPGKLAEAGGVLGKLNRIGYLNPESHPGIMKMLRWNEQEAEETRDGIPVSTMELSAVELTGLQLVTSHQVLKYMNNLGMGRALENMPVAWMRSASALCLLVLARTPSADAFFEAGRILERLWLTATVRGLAFQLLGVSSYFDRLLQGGGEGFSAEERKILEQARSRYAALFEIPP